MNIEARSRSLEIVDFDIAGVKKGLGKNWHYEPSCNGGWLLKTDEGTNGERTIIVIRSNSVMVQWRTSRETTLDDGSMVVFEKPIGVDINELDDGISWEDVEAGEADAPGIIFKGKGIQSLDLRPIGEDISLWGEFKGATVNQNIPNPNGSL